MGRSKVPESANKLKPSEGSRPNRSDGQSSSNTYRAPALEKGLQILELLSSNRQPMTVAQIALSLSRSRNEIYRMIQVLEDRGYIARNGDADGYLITNRLFDLGMRNPPIRSIHDAALPIMHQLTESILQSCQLVVLSGDHIVVVARIESSAEIGFSVRLGYRRHVTQSTSGRILCAMQPRERRQHWLKMLETSAPDRSDYRRFRRALAEISRRGYEIQPSWFVDGITDISTPIFDGVHEGAVAALTVPFVRGRASTLSVEDALPMIIAAAERVSNELAPARERGELPKE